MRDFFNLDGNIAIVTGASGGLGRHFSEVLAGAGAIVCVAARRLERVNETINGIESLGGRAFGFEMDVTNMVSVESTFELIEKNIGPVTIVINNAVTVPPRVLTVKYLKTSKPGSTFTRTDPRYSNIYKPFHLHAP